MVDFALVLQPSEGLQRSIDIYVLSSPTATINQTVYQPLKSRPAPVFIETKTSAGNIEAAKVQLGVWIAAWHNSLHALMSHHGKHDRIITVPLLQAVNGVWTVMFAVDVGD